MKIAIIGGNSFIGTALIENLLKYGHQIIATYMNNPSSVDNVLVNWKQVDILNKCWTEDILLELKKCDVIYICSWAGTKEINNRDINSKSYNGLFLLFSKVFERHHSVCQVVYLGTQAEYGSLYGRITEMTECNPSTEYGKYKYELGKSLRDLCSYNDVKFIHFRLHSIYGPHSGGILDVLIKSLLKKRECELTTNCEQHWNYLYIDDCISYLMLPIKMNIEAGIYNIGYEQGLKLKDYFELVSRRIEPRGVIKYGSEYDSVWQCNFEYITEKIDNLLVGYSKTEFTVGVDKVLEVYMDELQNM